MTRDEVDRLVGGRGSRPGDDRGLPSRSLDDGRDDAAALLPRERRRFPGAPAGIERADPLLNQMLGEPPERR